MLTQHLPKKDLTTGVRPTNVYRIMKKQLHLQTISSYDKGK
jgi:hypothetical protein